MNQDQIIAGLQKFVDGTINAEEKNSLQQWIASADAATIDQVMQRYEQVVMSKETDSGPDALLLAKIKERIAAINVEEGLSLSAPLGKTKIVPIVHRIQFQRSWWWAAACIILLLGAGTYFLFFNKSAKQPGIVENIASGDVKAPETNRAMITLANGQRVYLDSAANGQLALQDNVKLVKLANGQIAYETVTGEGLAVITYNILSNPRGSKVVDLKLADGSHVWLNAGSSLTYPVAFAGSERRVSITGEAYFEVAHDATKPFYVSKGDMKVQVLGTHFNVNAYDDETDMKITLLEGSVKVNDQMILQPGQQAVIADEITLNRNADIEQVMAWKNGIFSFNRTGIESIMRQVSRWYDVEVLYEEGVKGLAFTGDIGRKENVSQVLKMLEATGVIHFVIEGKRIVAKP